MEVSSATGEDDIVSVGVEKLCSPDRRAPDLHRRQHRVGRRMGISGNVMQVDDPRRARRQEDWVLRVEGERRDGGLVPVRNIS